MHYDILHKNVFEGVFCKLDTKQYRPKKRSKRHITKKKKDVDEDENDEDVSIFTKIPIQNKSNCLGETTRNRDRHSKYGVKRIYHLVRQPFPRSPKYL